GFVAGSYVVFADAFPSRYVTDAYRGGQALINKLSDYNDPYPGTLWQPARTDAQGVTIHDPSRSFAGPTLYTVGHAQRPFSYRPAAKPCTSGICPIARFGTRQRQQRTLVLTNSSTTGRRICTPMAISW
ncbi:MAG: hypothetical protein AAF637_01090, partial [Pseudomonadota bacterium]